MDISVISDVHLGSKGCRSKELLQYLKSIQPDILILNGDFLDFWQFRIRQLPAEHQEVLDTISRMADQGTEVFYITANREAGLHRMWGFTSERIHLRDHLEMMWQGKRYFIFHGDGFDFARRFYPRFSKTVKAVYQYVVRVNRLVNRTLSRLGGTPLPLARVLRYRFKKAVNWVGDFENAAIRLAGEKDYDCIICGHIHKPQMRVSTLAGDRQVTYLNAGDWIEHLTALEFQWGKWNLYQYDPGDFVDLGSGQLADSDEAPLASPRLGRQLPDRRKWSAF